MNVYIGGAKDYSAMRGPAPEGFHVPTREELIGIKSIMTQLNIVTGEKWSNYLHLPLSGYRYYENGNVMFQGSGYYRLSTPRTQASTLSSYYMGLNQNNEVGIYNFNYSSCGMHIRAFKDTYVAPDSSWTVVQGTLGGAGIFRNQTEGLISITSDGTTGYTMQDKNLGATTVYNNGDTLTQANMGNMYQWGNNYGFPSTGSVTISSTQVNAQNYGPGNYYSGSTFITRSSSPYSWDSSNNNDLRGGETGVVPAELKNDYIGEFNPKDLLSNIIAYYPMQGNLNDESGNGYNLSKLAGSYSGGTNYNTFTDFAAYNTALTYNTTSSSTISTWYNKGNSSNSDTILFSLGDDITTPATSGYGWGVMIFPTTAYIVVNGSAYNTTAISLQTGWNMYSLVFDYTNKTLKFYVNAVLQSTKTGIGSGSIRGGTRCCIGTVKSGNSFPQTQTVTGYQGITFATQNAMSTNDLLAFYNATKSLYGL